MADELSRHLQRSLHLHPRSDFARSQLRRFREANPDGFTITQNLCVMNQATDLYDEENTELRFWDGMLDDVAVKVHISGGTPRLNKEMINMCNILQKFNHENLLLVKGITKTTVDDAPPEPAKDVIVFISDQFNTTLRNYIGANLDRCFKLHAVGYDMEPSLKNIILNVASTLNHVIEKQAGFSNLNMDNILVHVRDGIPIVKLGIGIEEDDRFSAEECLANLLDEIFRHFGKEQCHLIKDFISLMRICARPHRPIPQSLISHHPIFGSREQRRMLLHLSDTMSSDPYKFIKYEGYAWPTDPYLLKMASKTGQRYDRHFGGFLKFVIYMMHHPEVVGRQESVGFEDKVFFDDDYDFLDYVDNAVPHFWSAVGRMVVLQKMERHASTSRSYSS